MNKNKKQNLNVLIGVGEKWGVCYQINEPIVYNNLKMIKPPKAPI